MRRRGWPLLACALLVLAFCAIAVAVVLHEVLTTVLLTACAAGLIAAGVRLLAGAGRGR
ncbi:hypothetical protein ACFC1R_05285 [Kitasatospora sp. NPDC056138]|uniref:hypothetical protein n=1 Tax=Kitasatospora sp. NPDC056138 TaxID=3345724 RepID=UPI0035D8220C